MLTDYIKRESLTHMTEVGEFSEVSLVSIFETLRRTLPAVPVCVLSGSLIILPDTVALPEVKHTRTAIPGTGYSTVNISGSLFSAVAWVGELFARGDVQILIGTKSLLGEGWDAPCINSLILASFVSSFVLSNQMRGRAIRIDKAHPDKTANIWHLVTVEPPYLFTEEKAEAAHLYLSRDHESLPSYDYEVLKRRFDAFMGPHYETGRIESGIERISAVKPPFDKAGIARINEAMLTRSRDRAGMREAWAGEIGDGIFAVHLETAVDREVRVPVFTFRNVILAVLLATVEAVCLQAFIRAIVHAAPTLGLWVFLFVGISIPLLYGGIRLLQRLVRHIAPARSIATLGRAVYRTMVECELIAPDGRVDAREDKQSGSVCLLLRNASIHDQNLFNTAMAELLSPIENPRYIIIGQNRLTGYNHRLSFACPSVIGKKQEYAAILADKLRRTTGHFVPVYTRVDNGRAFILKCRKRSFITKNRRLDRKYKVKRWE